MKHKKDRENVKWRIQVQIECEQNNTNMKQISKRLSTGYRASEVKKQIKLHHISEFEFDHCVCDSSVGQRVRLFTLYIVHFIIAIPFIYFLFLFCYQNKNHDNSKAMSSILFYFIFLLNCFIFLPLTLNFRCLYVYRLKKSACVYFYLVEWLAWVICM